MLIKVETPFDFMCASRGHVGVQWAAIILSLLVVFGARADANEDLRGIRTAEFSSVLSKDSKECGLESAALETALKLPIRAYTPIKEQKATSGIIIH